MGSRRREGKQGTTELQAKFPKATQVLKDKGYLDEAGQESPLDVTTAAPRRKRTKEELPQVEIPDDLLADPVRMNYLLLLAFLSYHNGQMEFTQEQLDVDSGLYNIFFAKTMKGDKISVSLVSVQSAVIKAPERGPSGETWPGKQHELRPVPLTVLPGGKIRLPDGTEGTLLPADATPEELLAATSPSLSPQERFLQQGNGEMKMPMPFEVGDKPSETKPFDLGAMARESSKLGEIRETENQAAERVDRLGY